MTTVVNIKKTKLWLLLRKIKYFFIINWEVFITGPYKFSFNNYREFLFIYRDIFIEEIYKFETLKKSPLIIDAGAHIGISVLYFKNLYPMAKIIAFEPNPESFSLLSKNLKDNKIKKVTIKNSALSDKYGSIDFYINKKWSWSDSAFKNSQNKKTEKISVKSEKLSLYLQKEVDLLKLDIEGSELKVLQDIKNKLKKIKNIIIEFHRDKLSQKDLFKILNILDKNSYSYYFNDSGIKVFNKKDLTNNVNESLLIYATQKPSS